MCAPTTTRATIESKVSRLCFHMLSGQISSFFFSLFHFIWSYSLSTRLPLFLAYRSLPALKFSIQTQRALSLSTPQRNQFASLKSDLWAKIFFHYSEFLRPEKKVEVFSRKFSIVCNVHASNRQSPSIFDVRICRPSNIWLAEQEQSTEKKIGTKILTHENIVLRKVRSPLLGPGRRVRVKRALFFWGQFRAVQLCKSSGSICFDILSSSFLLWLLML